MNFGNRNTKRATKRRAASGLARHAALSLVLLSVPLWSMGQRRSALPPPRPAPMRPAPRPTPAPARQNPARPGNSGTLYRPAPSYPPAARNFRPVPNSSIRPGQEHLPQWMEQHQNLSPSQQENQLRREPGFNRLPAEQQQRVMNRLRALDSRPPAERERMVARNEMFERLSPEQRQDVRSSAQSMHMMPPDRQRMMTHAFNNLRQIPPEQRQQILNSARFAHDFSPDERHVLGSLLSVEPYRQ